MRLTKERCKHGGLHPEGHTAPLLNLPLPRGGVSKTRSARFNAGDNEMKPAGWVLANRRHARF